VNEANTSERAGALRRIKPYPVYKDSSVEWLGEIPEHWEVKRLKFGAELNPPPLAARRLSQDAEVSFVPMEAVGEYGGLDLSRTKPLADVGSGYTFFGDGDVVVAKITPCFENGKGALAAGLANGVAFGTTELHVLRASDAVDREYLFYVTLTDAFRRLGEAEMYGAGGQKRVPETFIENLKHPIPPKPEQRAIAAFLDRETARIDALVAKKEQLIQLLQEKRIAFITRAVTKGLEPSIITKDSGVEWLGAVPAHWEVSRMKDISFLKGRLGWQGLRADEYAEEGPYVVSSEYFNKASIDWARCPRVTVERYKMDAAIQLAVGDVLLMKDGAAMGKLAYVDSLPGPACLNSHLLLFRPIRQSYHARYIFYVLWSREFQEYTKLNGTGATFLGVSQQSVGDYLLALPPLHEQRIVAAFLDREILKIDTLVAKVREGIERLNQFRAALISAAVTGKIDVREGAA
jgi:type I restriction enzyme S subunit